MITSNELLEVYMLFQTDGSLRYDSYRQRFIDNICAACSALIQYGKKKIIPQFTACVDDSHKYAVALKIQSVNSNLELVLKITESDCPEHIFETVQKVIREVCIEPLVYEDASGIWIY